MVEGSAVRKAPVKIGTRRLRPAHPNARKRPDEATPATSASSTSATTSRSLAVAGAAAPTGAIVCAPPAVAQIAGPDAAPELSMRLADFCTSYKKRKGAKSMTKPEKRSKPAAQAPAPRPAPRPNGSEKAAAAPKRATVQIIDGRIVVTEASLVAEPTAIVAEAPLEEVTEDAGTIGSSTSYTVRAHTERWGLEETRRFYSAVQQCGTDFTLMRSFFPSRNQRQLKRKYKQEERNHPDLISLALQPNMAKPLDVETFESSLGPLSDAYAKPDIKNNDDDEDEQRKSNNPAASHADHLFDPDQDEDLVAV